MVPCNSIEDHYWDLFFDIPWRHALLHVIEKNEIEILLLINQFQSFSNFESSNWLTEWSFSINVISIYTSAKASTNSQKVVFPYYISDKDFFL